MAKKKKLIVFASLALVILLGAAYLWSPGAVPSGQPPLVTLSPANSAPFVRAFDSAADAPHLVLLFSPT